MTEVRKILFALAVAVTLGWIAASTASAQVVFFAGTSGARPLRFEGLTEATGTVVLSSTSAGTIGGAALPAGGSQIIFDYGTPVLSSGDSAPPNVLLPCSGTVGLTLGGVFQIASNFIVKSCVGSTVILTFIANAACGGYCTITLSGVRVNANFLGAGASVSVSLSVISTNQVTNPITFSTLGALVVGTVQAAPSTTVFKP